MHKSLYVYYCREIPPTPETVPASGLVERVTYKERRYVAEVDCMAVGYVVYIRPLTPKEVASCRLISAPREG